MKTLQHFETYTIFSEWSEWFRRKHYSILKRTLYFQNDAKGLRKNFPAFWKVDCIFWMKRIFEQKTLQQFEKYFIFSEWSEWFKRKHYSILKSTPYFQKGANGSGETLQLIENVTVFSEWCEWFKRKVTAFWKIHCIFRMERMVQEKRYSIFKCTLYF